MADAAKTEAKAKTASKNVRSPAYPVISLSEAVERIRQIYAKEFTHPAPRETLAKDMGYGGLNGASASIISALGKYGLLESVGDEQHKLSADAMDIILHRKGEPERVKAIQKVAFLPTLYSDLRSTYGDKVDRLPSEHTIEAHLIKRGFNPKTVGGAIRSYRDTIAFVDEETQGFSTEAKGDPMQTLATNQGGPRNEGVRTQGQGQNQGTLWGAEATDDVGRVITLPIGLGADARVILRGNITQEAIDTLIEYLKITKRSYPKESTIPRNSPFSEHYPYDNMAPGDEGEGN